MGFFSFDCKECGHPMLCNYSSDEEINGWMKEAVVLEPNGSRLIGEYDGYGRVGGSSYADGDIGDDAVWLHQACWEVAGKPERDAFDGPSDHSADQGYFFDREHDMIDPRVTDEEERKRLLEEGIRIREEHRYERRAEKVAEWLDPEEREWHDEDKKKEPWRHRFHYSAAYENQQKLEGQWWLRDEFGPEYGGLPVVDDDDELITFKGTEDEVKAHLARLWAQFVESDEARAYVEHRAKKRREYKLEALERLKADGRYEVSYGPAPKGDTVKKAGERDWVGGRTIYRVEDRLTYKTVAKMDGPDKALGVKTFVEDPDYEGNNSPEWEARVEDLRAATRESRRLAEEECQRLNDQWARDGYPLPEDYL